MSFLVLLLACSGGDPVATSPPAPPAVEAPAPVAEAPTADPAPAPRARLDVGCSSELVGYYEELLASGCELKSVEDGIGTVPRILRNVPFAARGYDFNSQELKTFFTSAKAGCESSWYRPTGRDVELPEVEAACTKKLKLAEMSVRKQHDLPDHVEAYLLENHADALLKEVMRHLGKDDGRDRLMIGREEGKLRLTFYEEDTFEGETFESAVVVTCDDKRCETMFAG